MYVCMYLDIYMYVCMYSYIYNFFYSQVFFMDLCKASHFLYKGPAHYCLNLFQGLCIFVAIGNETLYPLYILDSYGCYFKKLFLYVFFF